MKVDIAKLDEQDMMLMLLQTKQLNYDRKTYKDIEVEEFEYLSAFKPIPKIEPRSMLSPTSLTENQLEATNNLVSKFEKLEDTELNTPEEVKEVIDQIDTQILHAEANEEDLGITSTLEDLKNKIIKPPVLGLLADIEDDEEYEVEEVEISEELEETQETNSEDEDYYYEDEYYYVDENGEELEQTIPTLSTQEGYLEIEDEEPEYDEEAEEEYEDGYEVEYESEYEYEVDYGYDTEVEEQEFDDDDEEYEKEYEPEEEEYELEYETESEFDDDDEEYEEEYYEEDEYETETDLEDSDYEVEFDDDDEEYEEEYEIDYDNPDEGYEVEAVENVIFDDDEEEEEYEEDNQVYEEEKVKKSSKSRLKNEVDINSTSSAIKTPSSEVGKSSSKRKSKTNKTISKSSKNKGKSSSGRSKTRTTGGNTVNHQKQVDNEVYNSPNTNSSGRSNTQVEISGPNLSIPKPPVKEGKRLTPIERLKQDYTENASLVPRDAKSLVQRYRGIKFFEVADKYIAKNELIKAINKGEIIRKNDRLW